MQRRLRFYAEGRPGSWEAICLDLDIAVQGESFEDVYHSMNDALRQYIDAVAELPAEDQRRLLNRKVPLGMRLKFFWRVLCATFGARDRNSDGGKERIAGTAGLPKPAHAH